MIARKTTLIVSTDLANAGLGYLILFFISRYMTPWEYGVVGFAFGFVTLFQILGSFGFPSAHIKRVSEGKNLGKCIGTFFSIRILLMFLLISVVLSVTFLWNLYSGGSGFESSIHEKAIYMMLIYCAFAIIANSISSTFTARREIAKVQIPIFLEMIARTSATIFVAINDLGVLALVSTYLIGLSVRFISSLYFFRGYPIKRPDLITLKSYSSFAAPMILVSTCFTIMNSIDKVLIQFFWSSTNVGYYFASFRITSFVSMFTLAVGTLLFPTFSEFHKNNNTKGIRELILKSERYLSMIIFPLTFILIALAEPIVKILLSNWAPAIPILRILPIYALFAALERPYQSQFLGTDMPKIARNRVLIMVFFNIFLNLILIPKNLQLITFNFNLAGLGAEGAAIATVVSFGIGLIYSRIVAWRIKKINGSAKILLHAIAAGIMGIVLYIMQYNFNMIEIITKWYILLGFVLLGTGIYLGILLLFREFKKEDINFFLDSINIKKMLEYVKNEVKK